MAETESYREQLGEDFEDIQYSDVDNTSEDDGNTVVNGEQMEESPPTVYKQEQSGPDTELRRRTASGPRRVTFAEDLPIRDVDSTPVEPDPKPSDSHSFFDVPDTLILSFLFKQLVGMRIFVIFLQFIFNWWDFSTDAFKGIPTRKEELNLFDVAIQRFFAGFKRWDAVHFLHVAEHGYVWEQNLAFFPFFPYMIQFFSKFWASPLLYFKVIHVTTAYLLTAIGLNFFCFLIAGWMLYRIVFNVTNSKKQSIIAVLIFSVNPASIFFSSVYSESLYCALTFTGISLLLENCDGGNIQFVAALACFALSYATRSNGFLNLGYVVWLCFIDFLFKKSHNGKWYYTMDRPFSSVFLFALSFIVKCMLALLAVTYPIHIHGKQQWIRFCASAEPLHVADNVQQFADEHGYRIVGNRSDVDWCNTSSLLFPPFYSSIQKKYWDVGIFGYWQLKKIPCFLLAAPAFFIIGYGIWKTCHLSTRYTSMKTFLLDKGGYFPFAVHAWAMGMGAMFVYNSEVLTRVLFSSNPFPYMVLARWMSDLTPQVRLSDLMHPPRLPYLSNFCRRGLPEALFFVYLMTYYITGTMWHVTWLPFT